MFELQAQQLVLGFSSATDQAGQVVAFLTAVIPIQNQSRRGPSWQTFLEETDDPAGAISQQKDFGLHIAATQQQQEAQLAQDHLNISAAQAAGRRGSLAGHNCTFSPSKLARFSRASTSACSA